MVSVQIYAGGDVTFCECVFAVFDQLDLVTYEEVVKVPVFKRKTLVLLGLSRFLV